MAPQRWMVIVKGKKGGLELKPAYIWAYKICVWRYLLFIIHAHNALKNVVYIQLPMLMPCSNYDLLWQGTTIVFNWFFIWNNCI